MLYHCQALAPTAQRYASEHFRRYAQWFRPTKFSWDEAVGLVAFVETISPKAARFVFHWGHAGVKAYARLAKHMLAHEEVRAAVEANQASIGPDDGLAVLQAMKDGGWKGYGLPNIVVLSLKHLRDIGLSRAEIAKQTNLTIAQVEYALTPRKERSQRASSYASLGVGS